MREFRYRRTGLHVLTGMLFMISGLGFATFFIYMIISETKVEIMVLMLPFVLWIWAGYYNLFINRRKYIELEGDMIAIDRSPLIPKMRFSTNDIEVAAKADNKIRIGLKSGKEVELRLDSLSVFDIEELMKILKISE